ncbi:MAG TPA: glycosyltransferase family 2 protein [Tepidisphaeraceae bacterium]|jgi:hypothetical protein|nr:glycosyltransferase family 2 protein [Tepidisphaeraceae bacterium]
MTPLGPDISVVIISYNTREMTLDCLRALYAGLGELRAEVWVVDNASADGSADAVEKAFAQVRVIRNTENRGFAAANNQAIRQASGKYILLLNSDAFVEGGAVGAMVEYLEGHADVAVVGPRLLNRDGSLQHSCYRFPGPFRVMCESMLLSAAFANHPKVGDMRHWAHDEERMVDFVVGACFLVRRSAADEVGLLDERFFFYAEEADWCLRFAKAGWKVAFTPAAQVVHYGGGSGKAQSARVFSEFHRAQERFHRTHFGIAGLAFFRVMQIIGASLRIALFGAAAVVGLGGRAAKLHQVRKWARILWWTVGFRRPGLAEAVARP